MHVWPVKDKSKESTKEALVRLMSEEWNRFYHPVRYVRFDGDRGFAAVAKEFNAEKHKELPDIEFYAESSPYTNHNRIVDCAIKQIRRLAEANGVNFDGQPVQIDNMWYDEAIVIEQFVEKHNFVVHSGIGMPPYDMHTDVNKEWAYIRKKKEELNDMIIKQKEAGMWKLRKGQWLRMYLDPDKTRNKFIKDKRQFKTWGRFVKYDHGNVVATVQTKIKKKGIIEEKEVNVTVPIYYCIRDNPKKETRKFPLEQQEELDKIRDKFKDINFREVLEFRN